MLRPSYSDLMEALTDQGNIEQNVASRYTVVIAAAKRARQIIDGAESYSKGNVDKPVSFAVREMYEGHIKINSVYSDYVDENVDDMLSQFAEE